MSVCCGCVHVGGRGTVGVNRIGAEEEEEKEDDDDDDDDDDLHHVRL